MSTEILGNISQGKTHQEEKGGLYAVATLDGTLMLVIDEQILWYLNSIYIRIRTFIQYVNAFNTCI